MPSKKIDKKQIIDASINLIRNFVPLSARNIAKELNCSTQPIYYLYKNMKDLENDLYTEVKKIFDNFVNDFLSNKEVPRYKAFGLAFVNFAKQERGLYKHLYLDRLTETQNKFQLMVLNDTVSAFKSSLCEQNNLTLEQAKEFHLHMSIYTFGLATMQYFNSNTSKEDISNALSQEYHALISLYKQKE